MTQPKNKKAPILLTLSDMWKPITITVAANLIISLLAARNLNWSMPYVTPEWLLAGSTALLAVFTWMLWLSNHNMWRATEHHSKLVHRQTLAAERLVEVIGRHPHLRTAASLSEKKGRARKAA